METEFYSSSELKTLEHEEEPFSVTQTWDPWPPQTVTLMNLLVYFDFGSAFKENLIHKLSLFMTPGVLNTALLSSTLAGNFAPTQQLQFRWKLALSSSFSEGFQTATMLHSFLVIMRSTSSASCPFCILSKLFLRRLHSQWKLKIKRH